MSRFDKPIMMLAGLLVLVSFIVFAAPRAAVSQNPASAAASKPSPAPVDVNVVNAPSVVLPSGTTVGIGSFANTVKVDTSNPLPVSDVDNPARHPLVFSLPLDSGTWDLGNRTKVVSVHVPDNQRLVVEQVSVFGVLLRNSDQSLRLIIGSKAAGKFSEYHVPAIDFGPLGVAEEQYVASAQLRMYADPGTDVSISLIRNNLSGSLDSAEVNLSGYLVTLP